MCLQEHRQVAGSCTNKRFLLSGQWSQHGSQTLHTERQTKTGGKKERSGLSPRTMTLYTYRSPTGHAFHMLQFAFPTHCLTSCIACDSWVALHTSSQRRQIFKQQNDPPAPPPKNPPLLTGLLTNSLDVLDMQWAKLWRISCDTKWHISFELWVNRGTFLALTLTVLNKENARVCFVCYYDIFHFIESRLKTMVLTERH